MSSRLAWAIRDLSPKETNIGEEEEEGRGETAMLTEVDFGIGAG